MGKLRQFKICTAEINKKIVNILSKIAKSTTRTIGYSIDNVYNQTNDYFLHCYPVCDYYYIYFSQFDTRKVKNNTSPFLT